MTTVIEIKNFPLWISHISYDRGIIVSSSFNKLLKKERLKHIRRSHTKNDEARIQAYILSTTFHSLTSSLFTMYAMEEKRLQIWSVHWNTEFTETIMIIIFSLVS